MKHTSQERVKMPKGGVIRILDLTLAIAEAICPTNVTGVDCIVGKRAVSPSVGGTSTKSALVGMVFGLAEQDREMFSRLLPTLPPLRLPMDEGELQAFMEAYRTHPDRPQDWEPVLQDAKARKEEQLIIAGRHMKHINKMHAEGDIHFLDGSHTPIPEHIYGTCISKKSASQYLERCGLEVDDEGGQAYALSTDETQPNREEGRMADGNRAPVSTLPDSVKECSSSSDRSALHAQLMAFSFRGDLSSTIPKAIKTASDPTDHHAVWEELIKLAINKTPPLQGTSNGKISYLDRNGKENFFEKSMLTKRIKHALKRIKPHSRS
ncbi:hypothetical protein [Thauera sinica]|uniref:Uncharacterized protein n=1 Tax=Thauera sinica TaxID=2665146 RepID=A0ABW1AS99_9RHOO|nr:hypothetical protein [Thauera sp. K11]